MPHYGWSILLSFIQIEKCSTHQCESPDAIFHLYRATHYIFVFNSPVENVFPFLTISLKHSFFFVINLLSFEKWNTEMGRIFSSEMRETEWNTWSYSLFIWNNRSILYTWLRTDYSFRPVNVILNFFSIVNSRKIIWIWEKCFQRAHFDLLVIHRGIDSIWCALTSRSMKQEQSIELHCVIVHMNIHLRLSIDVDSGAIHNWHPLIVFCYLRRTTASAMRKRKLL